MLCVSIVTRKEMVRKQPVIPPRSANYDVNRNCFEHVTLKAHKSLKWLLQPIPISIFLAMILEAVLDVLDEDEIFQEHFSIAASDVSYCKVILCVEGYILWYSCGVMMTGTSWLAITWL